MPSLRLHGVAYTHPSTDGLPARPLFENLHLSFPRGWTSVVGPNGAGKSTLLRLLAGALSPVRGTVDRPSGWVVAHCEQAVDTAPPDVVAFGASWDRDAVVARARWRLDPDMLTGWTTLSHGERKRWQVAAALGRGAEVLLLDEPSNHLDVTARQALTQMLSEFRGVGVLVSHDRRLLGALSQRTVWLEDGRARTFDAGVDDVLRQRRTEQARRTEEQAEQKKRVRRLHREREARRATLARAEGSRSARRRMKGTRDADGRSVNRKARADAAAASHARRRAVMERRARQAEEALGACAVRPSVGGTFRFAAIEGRRVRLPGDPPRVLEANARVWVTGDNGAGKSTLLRAWAQAWPDADKLVLPQELSRAERRGIRDRLAGLPPALRGQTLACLAALGVPPGQALGSPSPSPGEARKMLLADGLTRGVRWLLLDEPTHHLDLPSVARLQDALMAFEGGLVLVTHDRALAEACTDTTWTVRPGRHGPAIEVGHRA